MRMIGLFDVAAIATTAALAWPASPAQAEHYCGFQDTKGAVVQCGYSSLTQCRQAVRGKDAICEPDPAFAKRRLRRADA